MKDNSEILIQDILEIINKIEGFIGSRTFEEFSADQMCHDATIRNLEIIGEAARNLPNDFVNKHPETPVKNAVQMRNVLIHDYGQIDLEIVWKTVQEDIPKLKEKLSIIS